MKIYKPIVHEDHDIKYPNLERNLVIALWIALLLALIALFYGINVLEHKMKEKESHHPTVEVQASPEFAREARILRDKAIAKLGKEERL
jgi:hypothetical protein